MAAWGLFSKLKEGLSGADGPPRTEAYALHLYGKLPIYKDFISTGFTEEGAKDFRDWLGNGFSRRWSLLEEFKGTDIPLHTFLLSLPGGKRAVAGVLWGSHDEGGLRQFPFTLFSVVPLGRPAADPLVALSFLEVFEERAAYIRRNFLPGRTVSSFYEGFRGARVEVPVKKPGRIAEAIEKEAKGVTLGEFAESLFGASAASEWPGFLGRLRSACKGSKGEGAGAVRLPLGNLLPAELQVQIWLTWLAGEGVLDGQGPSGTLVCRSGGRSRAVLFFRDLRPEDFLLLHPTARDYEFVEETAPVSSEETAPAEPAPAEPAPAAPPEAAAEAAPAAAEEAAVPGETVSATTPSPVPEPRGWNAPLSTFLRPGKEES